MIGVAGHQLLGFGAKGQVCEEDVAFLVEESAREGEVDSWALLSGVCFSFEAIGRPLKRRERLGRKKSYLILRL